MRHKWDVIGWNLLRCCKCGLEAMPSRVKRGVGKCPGRVLPDYAESVRHSPPPGEMDSATAREIEQSDVFFAIVTRYWIKEPWYKDEIAYAKALGKPFALAIEEGVNLGNLFGGCNIIAQTKFNRDKLDDKQLNDWVKSVRDYLVRTKGI